MESIVDFLKLRKQLSGRNLKILIVSVLIGLAIMLMFSGKSNIRLETVAVSPDEQYVACFGSGWKIHCFRADGSPAFVFDIPSDLSAGGQCTLWFEEDVLYALFYRTDKIASFSMDGTMLEVVESSMETEPPQFPSFTRQGNQYIYNGAKLDVVYDKRGFLGYWFFGAERYLAITPRNGETKIVYSWTATTRNLD